MSSDALFDFSLLTSAPSVEFARTVSTLTCQYMVGGNMLISVLDGLPLTAPRTVAEQRGTLLIEESFDGGANWHPRKAEKLGRGMMVNAVAHLTRLRAALDPPRRGFRVALRVRIAGPNVLPMQPVSVEMVFAGQQVRHCLRFDDEYVVSEMP